MKKFIRHFKILFIALFLGLLTAAEFLGSFGSQAFAAIELQTHQKIAVEHLLSHPSEKGALLFHSLGSGKTYIALEYTEKNPGKKVLIFLPEFLKSNWISQMKSFGVKNPARYEMISFNHSEQILKHDLRDTIVIVDEIHRFTQKIRSSFGQESEKFIAAYEKIKSAGKLLLLTGTPVFSDISDISYIANLFLNHEEQFYPTDPVKFKTEFMRVKPVTSLVRGHITESKLMFLTLPFVITVAAVVVLVATVPWAIPIAALGGGAIIPITNEIFPVNQVSFREFDADRWGAFAQKYISYYRVKPAEENHPKKEMIEKKFLYNHFQVDFFLSFIDEDLNKNQLKTILLEEGKNYTDHYLHFHSTRLQKELLGNALSGREIGNLEFKDEGSVIVESPKFLQILDIIKEQPGQVAVYSNYFVNGLQRFAQFLDRNGMKNDYLLLSPEQTVETQMNIIQQYNSAKKRILLIHPEITEGISLNGTEQFHILEPMSNEALLQQIVGRATRYQSHTHLPKERQLVKAYLWEAEIEYSKLKIPTSAGLIKREHWQKKYPEVNDSSWTKGIAELDSTYFLKGETPDARVKRNRLSVQKDVDSFEDLLARFSIEAKK